MNRNQISKLSVFILLTLVATPKTFGMNEGAGAATHADTSQTFTLNNGTGHHELAQTALELSDVFKKAINSTLKEGKAHTITIEAPADTLETFASCLTFIDSERKNGISIQSNEFIKNLSDYINIICNDNITTCYELINLAQMYDIDSIKQACALLLYSPERIADFKVNASSVANSNLRHIQDIKMVVDSGTFLPQQRLNGKDIANSVAFSPDGNQIASGLRNHAINIWHKNLDGSFNPEPQTLRGHTLSVYSVAFSPDGNQLASGSKDNTIKIWHKNLDGSFNPEPQTLQGHTNHVNSVAFSPDGNQLASGSGDNTIKIWHKNLDGSFNPEPQTLREHTDTVLSVVFSPDGNQLASGSGDNTIKIWHKNPDGTFALAQTLEEPRDFLVTQAVFSPDGQQIADNINRFGKAAIKIWTRHAGTFIFSQVLNERRRSLHSVAFSPDGQQIAGGTHDSIRIWTKKADGTFDLEGHDLDVFPEEKYRGEERLSLAIAFSPDGQQIIGGTMNTTIRIWHRDKKTISVSLLQAMLIEAIKQMPGMILDIREETDANQVLREIARSCIGTPAEAFVRAHVRMDWTPQTGAASSSAAAISQGAGAGAQ